MAPRRQRSTARATQQTVQAEHQPDPTNINTGAYESFNINGEVFFLTDSLSGTGGWSHIRDRHMGEAATDSDSKFPDGTTEQEVKELIRKAIANGKWYADTDPAEGDRPERKKRVYLWDSRADETAATRQIHQMCVVTTNEKQSNQHSIITAYPRYGEAISSTNGRRGDVAALDLGRQIETEAAAVVRRAIEIKEEVKKINESIIEHQHSRKIDSERFLSDISTKYTELFSKLEATKELLDALLKMQYGGRIIAF